MITVIVLVVLIAGSMALIWLRSAVGRAVDAGAEAVAASTRARRPAVFWIVPERVIPDVLAQAIAEAVAAERYNGVTIHTEILKGAQSIRVLVAPGSDVADVRSAALRAARALDPGSRLVI